MTRRRGRPTSIRFGLFGVLSALVLILIALSAWLIWVLAHQSVQIGGDSSPTTGEITLPAAPPGSGTAAHPGVEPKTSPMPLASVALETIPTAKPSIGIDPEQILARMTLEEKIGQIIMTGIPGAVLDGDTESLLKEYALGSVVYFRENSIDPVQTRLLSQALQSAAKSIGQGIPLLIAIDHEGGEVFRFQSGMTHFPSLMALGAAGSLDLAYQVGAANAVELRSAGINLDLGPVLDVNQEPLNPVIGLRSAGGIPGLVSSIGASYIQGLQTQGVIAAAKHFPGHGGATVDSHDALPVIDKTLIELIDTDWAPFRDAIRGDVGVVMMGHLAFSNVDPSMKPASMSPVLIQTYLREAMGFRGVVMTDAMNMRAITADFSAAAAAFEAFNAGCDILAYTDLESAIAARNVLLTAVRAGRISEDRLDQSVMRILELKGRFELFTPRPVAAESSWPEHERLARRIAEQAVTLIGSAAPPLIAKGQILLVTPSSLSSGSAVGDGVSYLGEQLQNGGFEVDEWIYPIDESGAAALILNQALTAYRQYPQAVFVTWNARLEQKRTGRSAQVEMIEAFQALGKPLIVVAAASPFDLTLLEPGKTGLAIYGVLDIQVEALVQTLTAAERPPGSLPIALDR